MENNINKIALIIEGGGMRGSFTAGIINTLLEEKIYFNYVAGISAGASNTVNYIARDMKRVKKSFVDIVQDPDFGGVRTFLAGKGYFHSDHIYNYSALDENLLPFDFKTFNDNPAELRIGAFQRDTGKMIYWTKNNIEDNMDLINMVRASSSLPIIMPPTFFKGDFYVDGGLGPCGGIPIDIAIQDGYRKFFILKSRPKSYTKTATKKNIFLEQYFKKYPFVLQAMKDRHIHYNNTQKLIRRLEEKGDAYIVYPKKMLVESSCKDIELLERNYYLGRVQGKQEVPKWRQFIESSQ